MTFCKIMKTIALIMLFSSTWNLAEDVPRTDSKNTQILTAVIRDVLFGKENKSAREFYGTKGDKTVVLLNGSGLDRKPVKWPAEFKPEIEGFTFVFGHQDESLLSEKHDRRLAIRIDRFAVDTTKPNGKKHPIWDMSPIRISIQNGGGSKNGSVIGGQTTWYSPEQKGNSWFVKFESALD